MGGCWSYDCMWPRNKTMRHRDNMFLILSINRDNETTRHRENTFLILSEANETPKLKLTRHQNLKTNRDTEH